MKMVIHETARLRHLEMPFLDSQIYDLIKMWEEEKLYCEAGNLKFNLIHARRDSLFSIITHPAVQFSLFILVPTLQVANCVNKRLLAEYAFYLKNSRKHVDRKRFKKKRVRKSLGQCYTRGR